MKLTDSRRAKLILMKILDYAELGGMKPEDCGICFEAVSNCLDNREQVEANMADLNMQIRKIVTSQATDITL